jgi:hypothetical protein
MADRRPMKDSYTLAELQRHGPDFEGYLKEYPQDQRKALIEVADTSFMCLQWFLSQGVEPTAAAIVRMAELVFQREGKQWTI